MEKQLAQFDHYLAKREFAKAAAILKKLLSQQPSDLQLKLCTARYHHAAGKVDKAEAIYRELLKSAAQPQLLDQARRGLQAIEAAELKEQRERIAEAIEQPLGQSAGLLGLEPIASELKQEAAIKLARILHLDPYTAKTQIPSRNLRLLRIGTYGELLVYGQQLQAVGLPAFAISLAAIDQIEVKSVAYFESEPIPQGNNGDRLTAFCLNAAQSHRYVADELDRLGFGWNEVTSCVISVLPTFSEVVNFDAKQKLIKEEQVLDLVNVCDLHLGDRNLILRFHDYLYQFNQGMQLAVPQVHKNLQPTVQERWSSLINWLEPNLPKNIQVYRDRDFKTFADMALAFSDFIKQVEPNLNLERKKESVWDNCFQLYSGMVFLRP
ncbi:hypothetical protein Pse7367_0086 [Thalassoporum mexicanum PCC 7367]|uniref:tetratricopeptide repeat protein n=1 Tax=Thalassoporum mexicanum TaxID=3457544 RepID=UPI00029F9F11|nr:tetratricopeptide repeat protein [Pseudanabaena sp. PCC 7367]AFY68404.1 hypothetical protein Pse7367_0086 [Pseudanabaena sp. PCC 7367]